MKFSIVIQPSAFDNLAETYAYLAQRYSADSALAWYEGCLEAIESLQERPERCPLARESRALGVEIRELLYRRHRSVYRVLFQVEPRAVRVLLVRHSARRSVAADDLGW